MITKEKFEFVIGCKPKDDDLERCNCDQAGEPGHLLCGWCKKCDRPRWECFCQDYPGTIRELHVPGYFDPVNANEYAFYKFKVSASKPDALIPNFGILPIPEQRRVELIFEDGVPGEIAPYLEDLLESNLNLTMKSALYEMLVSCVSKTLENLVDKGMLIRDIRGEWVFN